jgi:predicted PurR-regulated permease PerM
MKSLFGEMPTRILGLAILLIAGILLALTIRVLLVPCVAALFVAYLLEPVIVTLQRRGTDRGYSYLLLLAGIILIISSILAFTQSRRTETPATPEAGFAERIESQLDALGHWTNSRIPMLQKVDVADRLKQRATAAVELFLAELPGLVSSFFVNLLLVPFIAFFFIRDGKKLKRLIIELVPNRYFEMSLIMFYRIDRQIGGYMRARLIECMLVGFAQMVMMGIASMFVRQPAILLVSGVCGLTSLIPYVGPVIGTGFGVFLYLGTGQDSSAIWGLLIAALVAHVADNIFIAPAVLSHNVDLHPLSVALVLVIGSELMGVLGLLIAVPIAASIKVIAQEFYLNYQSQAP